MSGSVGQDTRISRVEAEVQTIRQEMGGLVTTVGNLTGDVRALGGILGRIEEAVARAQDRNEERELAGKPNLTAVVSVLITIITIIVGGAWLIGGQLARLDERSIRRDMEMERLYRSIDRDRIQGDINYGRQQAIDSR